MYICRFDPARLVQVVECWELQVGGHGVESSDWLPLWILLDLTRSPCIYLGYRVKSLGSKYPRFPVCHGYTTSLIAPESHCMVCYRFSFLHRQPLKHILKYRPQFQGFWRLGSSSTCAWRPILHISITILMGRDCDFDKFVAPFS